MPVSAPVIKTTWVFIEILLEKFPAQIRIRASRKPIYPLVD
jgi:hypothetical protein